MRISRLRWTVPVVLSVPSVMDLPVGLCSAQPATRFGENQNALWHIGRK